MKPLFAMLLITLSASAFAAGHPGVACHSDNLPDGNKEDLSIVRTSKGTYDVVFEQQVGDMFGNREPSRGEETTSVTLATGLTCHFSKTDKLIASCRRERDVGQELAYLTIKRAVETHTGDFAPFGRDYTNTVYYVDIHSPELKASVDVAGFPGDTKKGGYLSLDYLEGTCEVLK